MEREIKMFGTRWRLVWGPTGNDMRGTIHGASLYHKRLFFVRTHVDGLQPGFIPALNWARNFLKKNYNSFVPKWSGYIGRKSWPPDRLNGGPKPIRLMIIAQRTQKVE